MSSNSYDEYTSDIAIIGLSSRFPKSRTKDEYWYNLSNAKVMIDHFNNLELKKMGISENLLNNPNYIKAKGTIEDIYCFDSDLFNYSPREAELMDPQQRLLLECCWEALEDACCNPKNYNGLIGVFVGASINTYFLFNIFPNLVYNKEVPEETLIMIGNEKDFLATKVSYKLDLKGPSQTIQTACSSSLTAVHYACQSLLNFDSDIVLAGGVSITCPEKSGYLYRKEDINSANGECRPFDAQASGTVGGNGIGIVVLKRLQDAIKDHDKIYAIIKASAINNDGANKLGYTTPSIEGQLKVISLAHKYANINPRDISYIEAHGTGTLIGDPIEFKALQKAFEFGTNDKNFCALGRVKANIGHLDAASGIASLIKVILCLEKKQIPPEINFQDINPDINLENSPFYINSQLKEWESYNTKRTAAVSSFGIGGTNVHMIIQESPKLEKISNHNYPFYLVPFSANDYISLKELLQKHLHYLKLTTGCSIADISYSLQVGRIPLKVRCSFIVESVSELINQIEEYIQTFDSKNNFKDSITPYHSTLLINNNFDYLNTFEYINSGYFQTLKKYLDICMQTTATASYTQNQLNILKIFSCQYSYLKTLFHVGYKPSKIIIVPEVIIALCAALEIIDLHSAIQLITNSNVNYLEQKAMLCKYLSDEIENKELKTLIFVGNSLIPFTDFLINSVNEKIDIKQKWIDLIDVPDIQSLIISLFDNNLAKLLSPQTCNNDFLHIKNDDDIYKEFLAIISALWQNNINMIWEGMYKDDFRPNKISLPTYTFKKNFFCYNIAENIDKTDITIENSNSRNVLLKTEETKGKLNFNIQADNLIGEIQGLLIQIFAKVLNYPEITLDDNFFSIGGDSLTALEILSQIEVTIGIRLSLKDLLTHMTIRLISDQLYCELTNNSPNIKK